jgi:hypothetical protein
VARKKHLVSLESFVNEEPISLLARLREALPLIEASCQAGHTLRSIHHRLNEAGFTISYNTLATYRRRLNREPLNNSRTQAPKPIGNTESPTRSENPTHDRGDFDPAANFRRFAKKQVTWQYPSGPPDERKLVGGKEHE